MVSIEGTILEVMESWPLQLVVDAEQDRFQVALKEDTQVLEDSERVDPGRFRPGLRVRVEGARTGASALRADTVHIL